MPTDGEIDYRRMTLAELHESLSNIDARRYPLNHANLLKELELRQRHAVAEPLPDPNESTPVLRANPFPSLILPKKVFEKRGKLLAGLIVTPLIIGMLLIDEVPKTLITGDVLATQVAPWLIGLTLALLFARQALGAPTTEIYTKRGKVPASPRKWLLTIFLVGVGLAAMMGFLTHQTIVALGSFVSGPTERTTARVIAVSGPARRRARCRRTAEFEFPNGKTAEICAEHRRQDTFVPYGLIVGEVVIVEVTHNFVGDWATGMWKVQRVEPPPQDAGT